MAASEPTSSLSVDIDTLHPLALSQYFGALTVVWVVPLSETGFTPAPRLLLSTTLMYSELDKRPTPFDALIPNPSLYHFSNL